MFDEDVDLTPPSPTVKIIQLPLGPIGTNCYIVGPVDDERCVVIDPGGDVDRLREVLAEAGREPQAILITHGHWDHVGGVADLAEALMLPVYMPAGERDRLELLEEYAPEGLMEWRSWQVDEALEGGDEIDVAGMHLDVLSLPGHSPDHVGFMLAGIGIGGDHDGDSGWEQPPLLFSGDVLFEQSIGRTDLPGSDHAQLMETLRWMFETMDDATTVLPGHGGTTSIGRERETNDFVAEAAGFSQ